MSFSSQKRINHRNWNLRLGDQGGATDPFFNQVLLLIGGDYQANGIPLDYSKNAYVGTKTGALLNLQNAIGEFTGGYMNNPAVSDVSNPTNTNYFEYPVVHNFAGSPFCIEFWIYKNTYSDVYGQDLAYFIVHGTVFMLGLFTYSAGGKFGIQVNSINAYAPKFSDLAWHFVAINWDPLISAFGIYLDGVLVYNASIGSFGSAVSSISVMGGSGYNEAGFPGRMQEFRFTAASRYSGATCPVPNTRFPRQ